MKKFDQINVIPFIDIMLVLLAIVLMTASFISAGKIKVNIPEAETTEVLTPNDITHQITVTAGGEYYVNDQPATLDEINQKMKMWAKNQSIVLKIDAKAAFNAFIQISDLLRQNQLKNVQVMTQAKE